MSSINLKERTRREVAEYAAPLSVWTVKDESGLHSPILAFAAHPLCPRVLPPKFKTDDEAAAFARGFIAGAKFWAEFGGDK